MDFVNSNRDFKVNKLNIKKTVSALLVFLSVALFATSCNKEEDPKNTDETATVVTLPNVAVTEFSLKADKDVAANLDSVFFSIDLENGVIFNADSLPKGSKIDKIVPVIKYSTYITKAEINMEGGKTRTGVVDYLTNPNDSIDFTGTVTLTLATENEAMKKTYRIKLNVHEEDPDLFVWNETAVAALPSRMPSPVSQKSVRLKDNAVSLIQEADGTYTISNSSDLFSNSWTKHAVSFPFTPEVRSFTATTANLCLLDTDGKLYTSADGTSWSDSGQVWNAIIGSYADTAVGLRTGSSGLLYAQYPQRDLVEKAPVSNFPVSGFSNFVTHSNKWTSTPVGFFCGGVSADGSLSNAVWAFDGREWIELTSGGFPGVKGASLIPYFAYRNTSSSTLPEEFEVWMLVGGEKADGEFSRTLYISYDNGVNWRKASETIQLPDAIPAMTGCDNIVMESTEKANLSDAWTLLPTQTRRPRVVWNVEYDTLTWECPYIYLVGGFDPAGHLCNTIWRGVLNRLRFAPVI